MKTLRIVQTICFGALITLVVSCKKDETPDYQAQHDEKMAAFKSEYGITESHKLEDGLYIKYTSEVDADTSIAASPAGNSMVIVDLLGVMSTGVFEATRYEDAEGNGIVGSQIVYGPLRRDIRALPLGLGLALLDMQEGESAIVLMDHDLAFTTYEPLVYEVDLYRVVNNLELYDSLQFEAYKDSLNFNDLLVTQGGKSAYYKPITAGSDSVKPNAGDWITINISGHYVEADPAYVSDLPGRNFYPFDQVGDPDKLTFQYGYQGFPVSGIVEYSIGKMRIGEKWEVLSPTEWAFGASGFQHPQTAVSLVPKGIDIHYRIEVLEIERAE